MPDLLLIPLLVICITLGLAIYFSPSLLGMVVARQLLRERFALARAHRCRTVHLHAAVYAVGAALAIIAVFAEGTHLALDFPLASAALVLACSPPLLPEPTPELPVMRARIRL